jgi:YgiT-type zinc finger domain-containing protein
MGKETLACSACGASTRDDSVKICVWDTPGIVIIEDVPARICVECYEQFYDEATTFEIQKLRKEGFPRHLAKSTAEALVFSLSGKKGKKGREEEKGRQ